MAISALQPKSPMRVRTVQEVSQSRLAPPPLERRELPPPPRPSLFTWPSYWAPARLVPKTNAFLTVQVGVEDDADTVLLVEARVPAAVRDGERVGLRVVADDPDVEVTVVRSRSAPRFARWPARLRKAGAARRPVAAGRSCQTSSDRTSPSRSGGTLKRSATSSGRSELWAPAAAAASSRSIPIADRRAARNVAEVGMRRQDGEPRLGRAECGPRRADRTRRTLHDAGPGPGTTAVRERGVRGRGARGRPPPARCRPRRHGIEEIDASLFFVDGRGRGAG